MYTLHLTDWSTVSSCGIWEVELLEESVFSICCDGPSSSSADKLIYGVFLKSTKRANVSLSLTLPSRAVWWFSFMTILYQDTLSGLLLADASHRSVSGKDVHLHSPLCYYPFKRCSSAVPKQIIQILLWMDLLFLLADCKEPPLNLKHC